MHGRLHRRHPKRCFDAILRLGREPPVAFRETMPRKHGSPLQCKTRRVARRHAGLALIPRRGILAAEYTGLQQSENHERASTQYENVAIR